MSSIIDPNIPQQTSVQVDVNKMTDVVCANCGGHFFNLIFLFKKLSALLSPTGKETIIPIEAYACNDCGTVNKDLLPKGLNNNGSELV